MAQNFTCDAFMLKIYQILRSREDLKPIAEFIHDTIRDKLSGYAFGAILFEGIVLPEYKEIENILVNTTKGTMKYAGFAPNETYYFKILMNRNVSGKGYDVMSDDIFCLTIDNLTKPKKWSYTYAECFDKGFDRKLINIAGLAFR